MTNDLALLNRLFSSPQSAEAAWKEFLQRYSNLFLKIIWQFEKDRDEAMEKYLFVCSKLVEGEFGVLRKFNPGRLSKPPKLSTWLTVVVTNLCIESERGTHGRKRIPRAIQMLSPSDRKVFMLYYWKGLSLDEIEKTLSASNDGGTDSPAASLRRIMSVLAKSPRAGLAAAPRPIIVHYDDDVSAMAVPGNGNDEAETHNMMTTLVQTLPPVERTVVRLRFWQNLSAQQISHVLALPPKRVYKLLRKSLKSLRLQALRELRG